MNAGDRLTDDEREVERLADSITGCLSNVSLLPEWMRVHALGRDMRPLLILTARAVLASDWLREEIAYAHHEGFGRGVEWASRDVAARVDAARAEERELREVDQDGHSEAVAALLGQREALRAERDALAATVERVRAALHRLTVFADQRAKMWDPNPHDDEFNKGIRRALEDLAAALDAPAPEQPAECDHPGLDHDERWSYCGPCPSCGVCKFIGHGPLCADCYAAPEQPDGGAA